MPSPIEARQIVRKRLRDDFNFYASNALQIRTKTAEIVPLTLNQAQRNLMDVVNAQWAQDGKVRVIILKARQMGLSTAVGGFLYFRTSQNRAQKALVMTHKAESTAALFEMTKRYYDNTPDALRPSTKYSSKRELKFDKLDSGYMVATAGGDAVARGETLTLAHLSELAFWPKSNAKTLLSGILDAIPSTKGTAVFIESTANGVSGEFYDFWKKAEAGENGYIPIFLPWFIQDEYREPVPEGFERTPLEEDLAERFNLDNEQLMFRRLKVSEKGLELFQQEYPSTADEAFLTTGRPVFSTPQLSARKREAPLPLYAMGLVNDTIEKNPRGQLLVYRELEKGDPDKNVQPESYYIGADVAMGVRGGDFSVAQVLDSHKRQVGVWRGHIHPDNFATVLQALGYYYNTARIAVEANNHGILTCTRLAKDLAYPDFYTETVYDKLDDKETVNLGFRTTTKSKPLIIDQLRASIRDGEMELNDTATINELLTYIVTDSGSMEAEEGCHDDTVTSLAIANHIHEGIFTPVVSSDEYYIQAI
jgi:hypothetical protein